MKIAIPTTDNQLSLHFGHCEQFLLFEVDRQKKIIVGQDTLQPPAHEPGVLPAWLHQQGANVIVAGGMGGRAQELFTQNGIEVIVGASAEAPEKIVQAYLDGSLQAGSNSCDH